MNNEEYSRRYGQAAKTAVACCVAPGGPGLSIHPPIPIKNHRGRTPRHSSSSFWLAGSRKGHAPIIIAGSLREPHARFGWRRRPIRSTEDPVHATPRHLLPPLTSRRRRRKDSASASSAPAAFALARRCIFRWPRRVRPRDVGACCGPRPRRLPVGGRAWDR